VVRLINMSGDAGSSIPVDMELKLAFRGLQEKMMTTQQQLKISDMQIEQLKRQITHAQLVEKEIKNLPAETNMYEGVGRIFVKQPSSTVDKNLKEKVQTCGEKIKSIESNKVYLERSIKEGEENLRELVLSKRREQTH